MAFEYQLVMEVILFSMLFQGIITTHIPRFFRGRPRGREGMLGSPNVKRKVDLPVEQWFTQRLTHFNDSNRATWRQRYWYNSTNWKKGGPVFLMIGGEGKANPIWMVEGTWTKYANEFGAFTFMLEHRYYGLSHPTVDLSVENLQFLNSEQALADLAAFVQAMNEKFELEQSKWICFGGSYPGSLSAWFRLKYPHLVAGAVATSAPVFAKLNFKGYLDVVTASLQTSSYGHTCTDSIAVATSKLQSMVKTNSGRQQLSKMFRLCDSLENNDDDIFNFAASTAGNFMGVVQYNKDNRKFEGAAGSNVTIDVLCSIMSNTSTDELSRYAKVNTLMLDTYKEGCLEIKYDDMIEELRQTSWDSSAAFGERQWIYQTCTEFGFYQTSDSTNQPFGHLFPLKVSIKQCMDIFGLNFNETEIASGINRTNTNYGGLGIAGSKIVFPNGSIDPWHALGITKDVTAEEQAIFIQGTAHCANMYPECASDPPQLIQARMKIKDHIAKWLTSEHVAN
ncbi:putative serine protease K12H4.7 [Xenia sp. Carnegie-2017]|uniref:putative serine protease K12H4.7 n=1 Tax=Xenia sp. Carnegie-2017 TaxID=2897299 RepID=UPI001F0344CB|nr:putative serine protease K12H4.7 [Xenia sp. Carnegie-2017]